MVDTTGDTQVKYMPSLCGARHGKVHLSSTPLRLSSLLPFWQVREQLQSCRAFSSSLGYEVRRVSCRCRICEGCNQVHLAFLAAHDDIQLHKHRLRYGSNAELEKR